MHWHAARVAARVSKAPNLPARVAVGAEQAHDGGDARVQEGTELALRRSRRGPRLAPAARDVHMQVHQAGDHNASGCLDGQRHSQAHGVCTLRPQGVRGCVPVDLGLTRKRSLLQGAHSKAAATVTCSLERMPTISPPASRMLSC